MENLLEIAEEGHFELHLSWSQNEIVAQITVLHMTIRNLFIAEKLGIHWLDGQPYGEYICKHCQNFRHLIIPVFCTLICILNSHQNINAA